MRMTIKAQTPLSNADTSVLSPKASVGGTRPRLNSGLASALGYLPHTLPFSSRAWKRLRFWVRAHHARVPQSYVRLKYYNGVKKKKSIRHININTLFRTSNASVYTTTAPTTTSGNYPCPSLPFCDDALNLPLYGHAPHGGVQQTRVKL